MESWWLSKQDKQTRENAKVNLFFYFSLQILFSIFLTRQIKQLYHLGIIYTKKITLRRNATIAQIFNTIFIAIEWVFSKLCITP